MARPAEFERSDVLQKALLVFRNKGFASTSVKDLEHATGLKPGSIYSAFGNKRAFYIETLSVYFMNTRSNMDECLRENVNPVDGLRQFVDRVIAKVVSGTPERCCYVVKSALEFANGDDEIKALIREHFTIMEGKIISAITEAQQLGLLNTNQEPTILSKLMIHMLYGLNVESALAPDQDTLKNTVNCFFESVFNHKAAVKSDSLN